MNEIEICLQNKIANANGQLKPSVLQAILNLYQQGISQLTARMVKAECILIKQNVPWDERMPAICNAMRNTLECGAIVIGDDRDFNGFTISFNGNDKNAVVLIKNRKEKEKIDSSTKSLKIQSENSKQDPEQQELSLSKNFKVVMICAGKKQRFSSLTYNGQSVSFRAVSNRDHDEYLPDDLIDENEKISWRNYVSANQNQETIPFRAYELYSRNEYRDLYLKFDDDFYILSAGWGLVEAGYRLPDYDITFSTAANAPLNTRRNANNNYEDFNQLQVNFDDDIIFVGGKDYLTLFYTLTQNLTNRKIIYYNSQDAPNPQNGNYVYRRYYTNARTNWHYQLAKDLYDGIIP